MLNEDKIKLMTSIAFFEKREGKRIAPARRYFQNDYVSGRMMRAFFSYTICYLLCMLIWVLYSFDQLLDAVNLDQVAGMLRWAALIYVAGQALYLTITFRISRRRYEYARRGMKVYVAKLRRLEKRYEFQDRTKELIKEGVRHDDAART